MPALGCNLDAPVFKKKGEVPALIGSENYSSYPSKVSTKKTKDVIRNTVYLIGFRIIG